MIYTLTLNPAIDRTVIVPEVNYKDVTRVTRTVREAAGKGINVSKVINNMEETSICTGFVGGDNGDFINKSLQNDNIETFFVEVSENTRENIKVLSSNDGSVLELNEQGASISKKNLNNMFLYFDNTLKENDILVLAGSAPANVEHSIYQEIIKRYKKRNVITILDTSKNLFQLGIEAGPTIIKPNKYELEMYFDKEIHSFDELVESARLLLEKGVNEVYVTMGKDGSLYVSKEAVYKVTIPTITAKGTVGAGDSFVAGLAIAKSNGLDIEDTLKYASAVSIASCLQEGTSPGKKEDKDKYVKLINVERVEV